MTQISSGSSVVGAVKMNDGSVKLIGHHSPTGQLRKVEVDIPVADVGNFIDVLSVDADAELIGDGYSIHNVSSGCVVDVVVGDICIIIDKDQARKFAEEIIDQA